MKATKPFSILTIGMSISVTLGILLIPNMPPGVGLLCVLVLMLSFQIESQQRDVRKLAESMTALAVLAMKDEDE